MVEGNGGVSGGTIASARNALETEGSELSATASNAYYLAETVKG